jgi:hypothetical protein
MFVDFGLRHYLRTLRRCALFDNLIGQIHSKKFHRLLLQKNEVNHGSPHFRTWYLFKDSHVLVVVENITGNITSANVPVSFFVND